MPTIAKKRKSIPATSVITEEIYNQALSDYSKNLIDIDKLSAARDAKIKTINDEYSLKLAAPQKEREDNFKIIQTYCIQNRDTLFIGKKSIETFFGILGFRKNPPSLRALKGRNWKAITLMVKEKLPGYIRITEETNKELLLADRNKEEVKALLSECSIGISEVECFYIDSKQTKDIIK